MSTRAELVDVLDQLVAPFEADRSSSADRPDVRPSIAPSRARGTDDATIGVSLSRAEALSGARRTVAVTAREQCTRCNGTGAHGVGKRRCRRCGGTGLAALEHTLRLLIPPKVDDGTVLVVRGQGPRRHDGAAGDLFVRIDVH